MTEDGLTLQTATVTNDLYAARNTLTRRIVGPISTATMELDDSQMQDGDAAINAGEAIASDSISGTKIWLRVEANIPTDAGGGYANFFYSSDGGEFRQFGNRLI